MENTQLDGLRLSPHFKLSEFLNLQKHPDNLPTPQVLFNLKYGCQYLLEPARREVGAIIVNSGYRNEAYNRRLVDFLRTCVQVTKTNNFLLLTQFKVWSDTI